MGRCNWIDEGPCNWQGANEQRPSCWDLTFCLLTLQALVANRKRIEPRPLRLDVEPFRYIGGIDPIVIDRDLDGQLDTLFAIAVRRDVGIDLHLHDAGDAGLAEIIAVCERTRAAGLEGRITVSHGFSLGAATEDPFARTADAMAEAGVSLVTHGGGASPLPPVKALRERGVAVFAGNDDVRDPWSPFGNGDMLERAMLLAWRSGYRTDDDLAVAFDCAGAAGAAVLGHDGHGLAVGGRADLFTIDAETLAEAVAQQPRRDLVLKAGRLVARGGKTVAL